MSGLLRGRIFEITEWPSNKRWPLPCNDTIRAKLLANFVEEDGPLETKCWIWQGSMTGKYGSLSYRENYYVHRLSYRNFVGPFDEELQINHKCDVRLCLRPEHLKVGSSKENMDDMWERGRGVILIGDQRPNAVLNDEKVTEALGLLGKGYTQKEVAEMLGVSKTTMGDVATGRRWDHVPGERPEPHKPRLGTSGYRGVTQRRDKWEVCICANGRTMYFGCYANKVDAAIAYNYHVAYLGLNKPLNEIKIEDYTHD